MFVSQTLNSRIAQGRPEDPNLRAVQNNLGRIRKHPVSAIHAIVGTSAKERQEGQALLIFMDDKVRPGELVLKCS